MKKTGSKIGKNNELHSYDKLSEGARFREQYRSVFSATIIATFFVVPTGSILEIFLKWVLGFAMLFAALHLICTAASVKYHEPRWMYNMFYVSERFRMRCYDFAVDCFAVGALYFISLATVGFVEKIFNFHPVETVLWIILGVVMLVYGLTMGLVGHWLKKLDRKSSKDTHSLI